MTAPMPDLDKAAGVIETVSQAIVDALVEHAWVGSEIVSEGNGVIRMNTCRVNVEAIARALHSAGLLLPEGFVAVPREPTEAMIEAGNNALVSWVAPAMHSAHAYRAMIQAQADGAKALQDGRDG